VYWYPLAFVLAMIVTLEAAAYVRWLCEVSYLPEKP